MARQTIPNHESKVFQPLKTSNLAFRNRIVHAPTTLNMSDPAGHATRRLAAAYGTLAKGGYSAVIVGATCVRWDGLINERMLGLYDETYVIGFRDTVYEIKANDCLAGIQLFYGGLIPGLGSTIPLEPNKGWIPGTIAWGPNNVHTIGNPQSDVMPTHVYEDIVESYAQAARRAREAGFDFASFHFCHGSLPHVNLSLLVNQGRTDKYADRFLFIEEIIQRTQELCGKDFPIVPRLCCDENLEGGYDIEYFAEHYAPRLHALGIDALDCTFGSMLVLPSRDPEVSSAEYIGPAFYTPKVVNRKNIAALRAALLARNIDMPLIGSANLISPDHVRTMVDEAGADLASVCRLSLDDPQFPNKMLQDREDEIRLSTHTGASLLQGNIFGKGWAGSAQNPAFGRDDEYRLIPTRRPQRVVVVGGGSGGMEYAITAHDIGHDVLILEMSDRLGGAMDWAGNYPHVPNMELLQNQPNYHRRMIELRGIPVRLNTEATLEAILAEEPDVVVVATGSQAKLPDVDGLDTARSSGFGLTIDEVLSRCKPRPVGKKVLIWGAAEGAELALNYRLGERDVTLIDNGKSYRGARYVGSRALAVKQFMKKAGLQPLFGSTPVRIGDGSVTVCDADGAERDLTCDNLVICQGREPNNALANPLRLSRLTVHVVGDAREPRSYANAIHEAAYLSRTLG